MMIRRFYVNRRRPGILDMITPIVDGVSEYRLKWATNFDAAPTLFLSAPLAGYRDPSINPLVLEEINLGNRLRVVFNPTTYTIPDDKPFWLTLHHFNGVETQVTASTLIVPDTVATLSRLQGQIVVRGVVPSAASLAASLQLDLPRQMSDFRILNEGANPLFVAFDSGGYEFSVPVAATYSTFKGMASSLWLRGNGGPTTVSIACTVANPA